MVLLLVFKLGGNFKNIGVLSTVHQYISTKGTLATTERAYFNSMFTVKYKRLHKASNCLDVCLNSFKKGKYPREKGIYY